MGLCQMMFSPLWASGVSDAAQVTAGVLGTGIRVMDNAHGTRIRVVATTGIDRLAQCVYNEM